MSQGEKKEAFKPLTKAERSAARVVAVAIASLGLLGLANSFHRVDAAARPTFGWWAWSLPLGVDIGIGAFSALDILLARMDMRKAWLRFVPWTLTGATIYLNVSGEKTLFGRVGHGVLPCLWVLAVEIAAHVVRHRARLEQGKATSIRWRITPERIAVWVRLADASDTTVAQADAHRRVAKLARAVRRMDRRPLMAKRAKRRLETAMARAVTHAGLGTDAEVQAKFRAYLGALGAADNLTTIGLPAPWALSASAPAPADLDVPTHDNTEVPAVPVSPDTDTTPHPSLTDFADAFDIAAAEYLNDTTPRHDMTSGHDTIPAHDTTPRHDTTQHDTPAPVAARHDTHDTVVSHDTAPVGSSYRAGVGHDNGTVTRQVEPTQVEPAPAQSGVGRRRAAVVPTQRTPSIASLVREYLPVHGDDTITLRKVVADRLGKTADDIPEDTIRAAKRRAEKSADKSEPAGNYM